MKQKTECCNTVPLLPKGEGRDEGERGLQVPVRMSLQTIGSALIWERGCVGDQPQQRHLSNDSTRAYVLPCCG
jgi:hypothetical protein